jgi:hypothetical protein
MKKSTLDSIWIVVSASEESELRYLLKKREINHLFEGGIYGSPRSKREIFLI